jgi:hypothetical protein
MGTGATFYTVTDARFFPGTVALINSLRLVGHEEPVVLLDNGLTEEQRERFEHVARVVDVPSDSLPKSPLTLKPFPLLFNPRGIVVIIDSDIIVSASLAPTLGLADQGQICFYPDLPEVRARWYAEWQQLFSLSRIPRHQQYMNSGFVAFSVDRWPNLLEEWWEACSRIPADRVFTEENQPFRYGDQDALNAILMSEVRSEEQTVLPYEAVALPTEQSRVVDESRLVCERGGRQLSMLHHLSFPKVWSDEGLWRMVISEEWSRAGHIPDAGFPKLTFRDHLFRRLQGRRPPPDPYIRLFPRVAFGNDVVLSLESDDVPWWLRRGLRHRLALRWYRSFWVLALVKSAFTRRVKSRSNRP